MSYPMRGAPSSFRRPGTVMFVKAMINPSSTRNIRNDHHKSPVLHCCTLQSPLAALPIESEVFHQALSTTVRFSAGWRQPEIASVSWGALLVWPYISVISFMPEIPHLIVTYSYKVFLLPAHERAATWRHKSLRCRFMPRGNKLHSDGFGLLCLRLRGFGASFMAKQHINQSLRSLRTKSFLAEPFCETKYSLTCRS